MLQDNIVNILRFLRDNPRSTSQLVYEFRMHFITVRKRMKSMSDMGLVEKNEYPSGKRTSFEYKITDKGKAVLKALEIE